VILLMAIRRLRLKPRGAESHKDFITPGPDAMVGRPASEAAGFSINNLVTRGIGPDREHCG
jgi:hypothetical protein